MDRFPGRAGYNPANTAQGALGLLSCDGTLLTRFQLFACWDLQVLFRKSRFVPG